MKLAFHVDQLWFKAPGGIGTYVAELAPALATEEPTLELVPFRSTFPFDHGVDPFGSHDAVVLARGIRALYPSWFGRPALPASLADADIVHATNPAAVPPVHDDQRLVVTVHDLAFQRFPELFPHDWRWLYRVGLRAAAKRADAILVPSQSTADD